MPRQDVLGGVPESTLALAPQEVEATRSVRMREEGPISTVSCVSHERCVRRSAGRRRARTGRTKSSRTSEKTESVKGSQSVISLV